MDELERALFLRMRELLGLAELCDAPAEREALKAGWAEICEQVDTVAAGLKGNG